MIPRTASTLAILAALAPLHLAGTPPLSAQSPPRAATVTVPETPAGRALQAWLDAFNSGDRARMDAYYRRYEPDKSADGQMGFRNQTGGFDLVSLERREPRHIEFVVKERNGETTAFGFLDVEAGDSGRVTSFLLRAIPKGATLADFTIDSATRTRVVDSAVAKLHEYYVFPETAKQMEQAVRARQQRGEYAGVANGAIFANLLSQHFQEVSRDRHLRVNFNPLRTPPRPQRQGPTPEERERYKQQMERVNCGFAPVRRLANNVGYLKFDMFADPEVCGPTASKAMNELAGVGALIIDLRENGGGSPAMVAYVSSYLFAKRTHLNDLWERKNDSTTQYWTRDVPGPRLDTVSVYVLTARRTFSGAEEFSYNLKSLKRATIVGEVTGGGAHPVSGHRIDDRFSIGVPFARAINPITRTNWEGVGVEPDVKVPAAEALATAERLATEKRGAR